MPKQHQCGLVLKLLYFSSRQRGEHIGTRTKNHAWLVHFWMQFCIASSVVIGVLVYLSQLTMAVYLSKLWQYISVNYECACSTAPSLSSQRCQCSVHSSSPMSSYSCWLGLPHGLTQVCVCVCVCVCVSTSMYSGMS